MKIILASASPRRRELLTQAGLQFEVIPSQVEEHMTADLPQQVVQSLAAQKCTDVFERCRSEHKPAGDGTDKETLAVIGADTIVVCDGQRLGKPADEADALRMLMLLCGRWHEVYTGVSIRFAAGEDVSCEDFTVCTQVEMYPLTREEAVRYIQTGEPMDKAGAYGIQGYGAVFIRGISGDYYNVVGLPLARVWHCLRMHGLYQ